MGSRCMHGCFDIEAVVVGGGCFAVWGVLWRKVFFRE